MNKVIRLASVLACVLLSSCVMVLAPAGRGNNKGGSWVYMSYHGPENSKSAPADDSSDDSSNAPTSPGVIQKTAVVTTAPPVSGNSNEASTTTTQTVSCTYVEPPQAPSAPMMPPMTTEQRQDHNYVEQVLGNYILNLRTYISGVSDSNTKFYSDYQTNCRPATKK